MLTLILVSLLPFLVRAVAGATCNLRPLGRGRDDTDQIEAAIAKCGHNGLTIFEEGYYNVTRKMTWNLISSRVDLHGYLSFVPDIEYWLDPNNTYRVIFIQDQASWFVITGTDFVVDAHNTGGIEGNGQVWWEYYANRTRDDGDGRPVSLTLGNVTQGTIANFLINAQPFWCNAVAQSKDVVYDGMLCNATNTNPVYYGQNIVPNTDGIDTYRSDNVQLLNWDITTGDDCLAIKGNSSNLLARNITCRGGNGVAFGSLGQYGPLLPDYVTNVTIDGIHSMPLNLTIQPNIGSGVYFKTWDGSINGVPPTGGGGAGGRVSNVTVSNVHLDDVSLPLHIYQTNGGVSGDLPSLITFDHLVFENWSGNTTSSEIVDIQCSTLCSDISFTSFNVLPPSGETPKFVCINTTDVTGLSAPC